MNQQPKKSSKIWIVLGVLGGFFLLTICICCGAGLWLMRFPSVPASASQAFDYGTNPVPAVSIKRTSKYFHGLGAKTEVFFGDGSGYGKPAGSNSRLWVYMPDAKPQPSSTPCVLICGAGSTLMTGMKLSDGDEAEHQLFLRAGFIVVAYELDGPSDDNAPEPKSYQAFRDSNAGLANAQIAIEYVLSNIPEVNPKQIFSAGHSSAGTTALLLAEHEPRLAGCVAFAPCTDLKARIPAALVRTMSFRFEGLAEFLVRSSPRTHEMRIQCPVMLFHAADDSNVPIEESRAFAARLQSAGKDVTIKEVATGGHYQPMIDSGIAAGAAWIKQHLK